MKKNLIKKQQKDENDWAGIKHGNTISARIQNTTTRSYFKAIRIKLEMLN